MLMLPLDTVITLLQCNCDMNY